MNAILRINSLVALALLAACGSSESGVVRPVNDASIIGDTETDIQVPDVGSVEDIAVDTRGDDTVTVPDAELDTALPDASVQFCEDDDECDSNFCLLAGNADQGICASLCESNDDCPEDSECRLYTNSGGDAVNVCVPTRLCIDNDGDGFGFGPACIASDCDDTRDTVNLSADEVCDGTDNDCDGVTDDAPVDADDECATGFPGICATGRTTCDNGALICSASLTQQPERCDGLDNDCDGNTDEGDDGTPLNRTCYSGPASTVDVGVCRAGVELCNSGAYGSCTDQTLPVAETCDGLDSNCDGQTDEGSPGAGLVCISGVAGECSQGVTRCEGGAISCQPLNAPAVELCDNRDNDCDGTVDNGDPGGGALCNTGQPGICSAGLTTCSSGTVSCQQLEFASADICDGLDNNCNGLADEGNPGGGAACDTGRAGVCEAGITSCTGGEILCNQSTAASAEICDALDNDCNGAINNGCPDSIALGVGTASPQFADADGGSPYSIPCATGAAVVGFYGRSGSEIDAIGPVCAPIQLFERTDTTPWRYEVRGGTRTDTSTRGGGGGSPFRATCPANEFVIGVNGRAADRMDAWQFTCGTMSITGNPGSLAVTRTSVSTSAYLGGSGGSNFSYTCPENRIVTGISGRSGSLLDSISVTCSQLTFGVR
jgi:hypothetical protein